MLADGITPLPLSVMWPWWFYVIKLRISQVASSCSSLWTQPPQVLSAWCTLKPEALYEQGLSVTLYATRTLLQNVSQKQHIHTQGHAVHTVPQHKKINEVISASIILNTWLAQHVQDRMMCIWVYATANVFVWWDVKSIKICKQVASAMPIFMWIEGHKFSWINKITGL